MDVVNIIIFSIAILLFSIDILNELNILRDIKNTFTCSNCGTLITEYRHNYKCDKCNKKVKIESKTWEHFLLRKVNWTSTINRDIKLCYSDYTKLSKREITICIICIGILILGIITSF